jgi:hypothetical protein
MYTNVMEAGGGRTILAYYCIYSLFVIRLPPS